MFFEGNVRKVMYFWNSLWIYLISVIVNRFFYMGVCLYE